MKQVRTGDCTVLADQLHAVGLASARCVLPHPARKLGSYEVMAVAPSISQFGYAFSGNIVIANPIVDNTQYSYFVFWSLPVTAVHNPSVSGDILGCRMWVAYTYNFYAYLPTVRK